VRLPPRFWIAGTGTRAGASIRLPPDALTQCGSTLTIVLVLAAMLQILALTQADIGWVALRDASARRERLLADASAEAALVRCAQWLAQGTLPVYAWSGQGEPAGWRSAQAFTGAQPVASSLSAIWPAPRSIAVPPAPQCLAESRPVTGRTDQGHASEVVLLTARGVGLDGSTQSYLQRIWRGGPASTAHARGWRSVAAVPD
jgi:Tfp pilus assembly protein PilX